MNNQPLSITTKGDTQLVVTRRFNASPEAVYRAHTEPELLQQWLLGPDGWTMPVCISEARPGGQIRYEWANESGEGFYITGEFLELQPYSRIVHVTRMFLPEPTPDNRIVTTFEPEGDGTLMTLLMQLPDRKTRDDMMTSGMANGMEDSYARMERTW